MVFEFIMVLEFTGFCNLFVDSGFRVLGFSILRFKQISENMIFLGWTDFCCVFIYNICLLYCVE